MTKGYRDTTSLTMLTGFDSATLAKFALADGMTFAQIVANINTALGALNAELYNDPFFSSVLSYTDQPSVEYRVGVSNGFEKHTEYGRPNAARAATDGHMLPLIKHDRGLGWTWDYLKDAWASQIEADIADAMYDARSLWRKAILTRLLTDTDDAVGASGYSPGFADVYTNTLVDFVPPSYNGTDFTSSHEHYVGIAGGVFTTAVFSDAYDELAEHGHEPPFDFVIGPSDRATVEGLTGFIPVADSLVRYGSTETVSAAAAAEGVIGTINHFLVREVRGIPRYYGAGYKSYGPNSQRNPLRARLERGVLRPQIIAMTDPRSGAGAAYPLQYLMLYVEIGVGVADRTAGTPRYVNSASWADATPT